MWEPRLTSACRRPPIASAPTSLRLSAAPDAQRSAPRGGCADRKFKRHFRAATPAARPPAHRLWPVLDRRLRMGEGSASGVPWGECLGKGGWESRFQSRATIVSPHRHKESAHGIEKHTRNPRLGQPARPLSGALGPPLSPRRGLRALFYLEVPSDMSIAGINHRRILTWRAWTTFVSDSRP